MPPPRPEPIRKLQRWLDSEVKKLQKTGSISSARLALGMQLGLSESTIRKMHTFGATSLRTATYVAEKLYQKVGASVKAKNELLPPRSARRGFVQAAPQTRTTQLAARPGLWQRGGSFQC